MAKTILISDRVNSFFTNNKIKAGTEIPTSGSYIKGDIIVNVGSNCADEPMWICTEDGNPGTWGLVGIGGGNSSLVSINESVTINTAASEVSLGSLAGVVSANDKLIVHYNSAHLMEGIDFTFNSDYTKIVKVEGVWNSNNDADSVFTFELLKNVETVEGSTIKMDSRLSSFVNNVNISSAATEVEIGIDGYKHEADMLMVFKNSTFIVEGVDYTVNGNKIVSMNGTWNSENSSNYSFAFVVFKEVAVINPDAVVNTENLVNGSITMDKLSNDVKQAIENASNIDLTGYQEKVDNGLVTVDKTIVGAINELFQSANNGKELIATAIGEPLNSSDTFSAMSTGINDLNSQFKAALMNNGVSVEGTDKFKQLIDKLATLVDSEGKGVKFAEGTREDITCVKTSSRQTFSLNMNLDFAPTVVIVNISGYLYNYTKYHCECTVNSLFHNSKSVCYLFGGLYTEGGVPIPPTGGFMAANIYITSSNDLSVYNNYYDSSSITLTGISWLAIGVGEEDTTLEDTLRDILANKGVEVTEEDDISNLITKVDSIDIHQPLTGSNIIYDNGTINTELTGGLFLAKPYSGDARCTFETDHIYVYPGANQASTSLTVNFRCRHPFSVYGYNKIKITYATRAFTVGSLKLKTEVYNWVSASTTTTSHDYTLSNPDSIGLNNTGGSSNITETTLNISDNTVPINIAIELKGVWNSNGPTQAGIYIHKIELLK